MYALKRVSKLCEAKHTTVFAYLSTSLSVVDRIRG